MGVSIKMKYENIIKYQCIFCLCFVPIIAPLKSKSYPIFKYTTFPPVPHLCHCNLGNSSKYCSDIRQCRCSYLNQLLPPFFDVVNQGAELWCNIATLWEIQIEARKLWKKVIKQRYKLTAFNIWPESFLSGNCYSSAGKSQPQHQTQIISRNLRFNRKVESSPVFFKWPAIRRNLRGLTPADTLMGISPGGEKALSTPGRKDQDDGGRHESSS